MVQLHTRGRVPPQRGGRGEKPIQQHHQSILSPQQQGGSSKSSHAPVVSEQSKAPMSKPKISIPLDHDGEMIFGNNFVRIKYTGGQSDTDEEYEFGLIQ
ncbi:unnamed protein product [Candida parapsilosis]